MKFLKNLFLVIFCIGAVGGVISFIESRNADEPVSYEENDNNNYYEDNYYDDSYNNSYDNSYDNSYNNNYDDSYNNNYNENYNDNYNSNTGSGTSFREKGQANRQKVQDALNRVNSGSNSSANNHPQQNTQNHFQQNTQQNNNQQNNNQQNNTQNNTQNNNQSSGGVNIIQIGGGNNDKGYDGRYDQGSPNYAGSSSSNNTYKPNSTVITKPNTNTNTNTNTTIKPNTNTTTKPNTNTNITTKPNTNININTNTNTNNNVVTKPSTGGTSKPVGQRVPLDTTGDYDDIVLTGSDRNDIVMMNINNNKDNLLSTLTGYEEPLRAAVGIFNAHKYEDIEALNKYNYSGKTNSDLTGDSMKYVAYKIVEYHKFSQQETDAVEKGARITMGIDDSSEITGYYRITMRVYQSQNRKINIIKDESRYPFYFTITLIEVDGTPYEYISLTRR